MSLQPCCPEFAPAILSLQLRTLMYPFAKPYIKAMSSTSN